MTSSSFGSTLTANRKAVEDATICNHFSPLSSLMSSGPFHYRRFHRSGKSYRTMNANNDVNARQLRSSLIVRTAPYCCSYDGGDDVCDMQVKSLEVVAKWKMMYAADTIPVPCLGSSDLPPLAGISFRRAFARQCHSPYR